MTENSYTILLHGKEITLYIIHCKRSEFQFILHLNRRNLLMAEFDAHEAHVGNEIRRAPGRINAGKERLEREKKAIQYVQKYTGDIWS